MSDDTLDLSGPHPVVVLRPWTGPVPPDHPDANFLADVAAHGLLDPVATVRRLAEHVGLPVGAVVHHVLASWAGAGSEALLALGPSAVQRMRDTVARAEESDDDAARLAAYRSLATQLEWLGHGLDDPDATYR